MQFLGFFSKVFCRAIKHFIELQRRWMDICFNPKRNLDCIIMLLNLKTEQQ